MSKLIVYHGTENLEGVIGSDALLCRASVQGRYHEIKLKYAASSQLIRKRFLSLIESNKSLIPDEILKKHSSNYLEFPKNDIEEIVFYNKEDFGFDSDFFEDHINHWEMLNVFFFPYYMHTKINAMREANAVVECAIPKIFFDDPNHLILTVHKSVKKDYFRRIYLIKSELPKKRIAKIKGLLELHKYSIPVIEK